MVPVHIGIIPDGNRRFGKKYNLSLAEAYEYGINKLKEVLEWSKEIGIKILTVWSFSTENINRNFFEKKVFFSLLKKKAEEVLNSDELEKNEIRCRFIGRLSLLPSSLTNILKKIEEKTENYKKFHLNVAIGYGGRQEIVDACNKIIKAGIKRVTINNFRKFLYTNGIPDPDLIIRTSGEYRLSGFLPWQTVYSELIFLKPLWPELTKEDFINAIKEFETRERRFGR
jgi:tritrans,polycis-undecaprenyl-diphosphate synthase [geranylgeranyl-diphosphate specific]